MSFDETIETREGPSTQPEESLITSTNLHSREAALRYIYQKDGPELHSILQNHREGSLPPLPSFEVLIHQRLFDDSLDSSPYHFTKEEATKCEFHLKGAILAWAFKFDLPMPSSPVPNMGWTLDSPTNSLDSDMFSIPESEASVPLITSEDGQLYEALDRLLSGFQNTHQRTGIEYVQRNGDINNEDGPLPRLSMESYQSNSRTEILACPFLIWEGQNPLQTPISWGRNSSTHSRCCEKVFSTILEVKWHISHSFDFEWCMVCEELLPSGISLKAHLDADKCSIPSTSKRSPKEILDHLEKRSEDSEEDQWFTIWEFLFPNHQKPSSPYLPACLRQFREYCSRYGLVILKEMGSETPEEHLDRVIAKGINLLYAELPN